MNRSADLHISYVSFIMCVYIVLFCVSVVQMLEQGTLKSLGVFLPELQEQFITHTWVIGLAISFSPGIGSFACLLILPAIRRGSIVDRSTVLIIAGLMCGLGLILASLTSESIGLVLALTMEGALAVAKVVSLGTLTSYYKENIELVTAIAMCGQSVGIMVMPPMAQIFLDIYGWRGAMMLLGSLGFHILLCGVIIRHEDKRKRSGYMQMQVFELEEEVTINKQCSTYVFSIFNLTLLGNISFINVLIQAASRGWAFTSWLIYLIPHAEEKGIALSDAVLLATFGGAGNLIGKLVCPVMRTFLSNRTTIMLSSALGGAALVIDPLLSTFAEMSVSSTLFALFMGVAFIASLNSINEVVAKDDVLDAYAWFYLVYGIVSMAGGFVTGLLFDTTDSSDLSFVVMGAVAIFPVISLAIEDIWRERSYWSSWITKMINILIRNIQPLDHET